MSDLFSIEGKVAVVTGGSRGIGLMIARGYVEAGAKVYISSRKKEVCDEVAAELSKLGTCISVPADLMTEEGRAELVAGVKAKEDTLDILMNNAGNNWGEPFAEYPDAAFDRVLGLNVKSIFALTRDFFPLLEKAASQDDPARVINIGSIDGIRVPYVENYAYAASKAAVHHMTRDMAVKFQGKFVTVNAIAPGPFESKMTEWMLDTYQEVIESACPLRRIGNPDDMAGIAIFLASKAGSYLNGTIIPVDGGIHLSGSR